MDKSESRFLFPISPFLVPAIFAVIVLAFAMIAGVAVTAEEIVAFFVSTYLWLLLFLGLPLFIAGIRIIPEYERAAVLRLGRYKGMLGPGMIVMDAIMDRAYRFDLRVQTVDIPQQEVLTKDNVNIKVDAVIIYRVFDPGKAFITVQNVRQVLFQYGQANLREVLGVHELDEILQKREEMAKIIQEEVDSVVGEWGIKIISVALQQIYLPENMVRAMAMQAEAERERRAKIISAEGEKQAAHIMAEAAEYYVKNPFALRLRELTTLVEIAKEKNVIVLFPTTFGHLEQTLASVLAVEKAAAKKEK